MSNKQEYTKFISYAVANLVPKVVFLIGNSATNWQSPI